MDEYIDIVTKEGNPTGKVALKSDAHKNGWYHNTIHLWLYTRKGEILLQQRSRKKKIYPLLWDVSTAGHIDAGEIFIEAALRETKEEIGLTLKPKHLHKIGTFLHETNYGDIQDNEFHQVYIAELTVDLNKLTPQKNEVEALKLVSFETFKKLLEQSETNQHFISTNKSYYSFIIKTIKEKLNI
ncbi:Hydrolase of MutT (Nudix) family protein [Flavobacteriales bacterium ALC-1]|nr:Hydrolase of MutT (Nudix) family protein [Flavobacteriales bacterium ALC-1]